MRSIIVPIVVVLATCSCSASATNLAKEEAAKCIKHLKSGAMQGIEVPALIRQLVKQVRENNADKSDLSLVKLIDDDTSNLQVQVDGPDAAFQFSGGCRDFDTQVLLEFAKECRFEILVGVEGEAHDEFAEQVKAEPEIDELVGAYKACYRLHLNRAPKW